MFRKTAAVECREPGRKAFVRYATQTGQGAFIMADNDRDTEHTTVVESSGGGGGGGVLAVVLLIIVVLVLLWVFRAQLGLTGDSGTDINVPNSIDVNVNQS
jgi:hypothetical protein